MTDIEDLQRRLSAALARIGAGVEALPAGPDPAIAEALEAEREANAQLEERVRAIKQMQETNVARLEAEVAALRRAVLERDGDLARLSEVNAALRGSNTALRVANAAGLADPALVNDAMQAELAALRQLQARDHAEMTEILGLLAPMLEEADHA